ncbi:purine-binding chemotaxis protein CheW [Aggregicoccus sp. 17bor-14]|uniref:chemotaxis protein CheW n=1 Tax=Myxococcaceae TaxID=31 RepID=UPI00129CB3D0|nr:MULTISPECIES: chemotaxis protein CheW [Myxococcaceae]MBF5041407.1 purine-binding chemotaxis protein CheW [Simulacricoccus sp. 17bor-14]MRI87191.1 purine-binding chemotaxis protein CheW [Aggregicoccus sp. 17bor-14]
MSAESSPSSAQVNFAELYRRLDEARAVLERGQAVSEGHRKEVLAARAKALAGSREEVRQELLSVLAFQVGGERYAVPLAAVDHVLEARGLCPLPGAPRHVLGALVSRSRVVAVLDLRQLLGLEGGGMSDLTRVVVVDVGEESFGLAAESVDGRLELPRAELMRPPPGPFSHLGPQRLTILDLEQLGDAGAARRE